MCQWGFLTRQNKNTKANTCKYFYKTGYFFQKMENQVDIPRPRRKGGVFSQNRGIFDREITALTQRTTTPEGTTTVTHVYQISQQMRGLEIDSVRKNMGVIGEQKSTWENPSAKKLLCTRFLTAVLTKNF